MRVRVCSFTPLLVLIALLSSSSGADPLQTASSSSALARCSSSCTAPKRCSLVSGRAACRDFCYTDRCSRSENCVQRQCDTTNPQRPCDPRVFCFAATTSSTSATSPPLSVVSDSAGFPTVLFGSTLDIPDVTAATQAPAWSQATSVIVQSVPAASQTPDKPQPSAERACGPDSNSSSVTCDELQACVQDGRATSSRVCMDLCVPQCCHASQVCHRRTLALCAGERTCLKVATCK